MPESGAKKTRNMKPVLILRTCWKRSAVSILWRQSISQARLRLLEHFPRFLGCEIWSVNYWQQLRSDQPDPTWQSSLHGGRTGELLPSGQWDWPPSQQSHQIASLNLCRDHILLIWFTISQDWFYFAWTQQPAQYQADKNVPMFFIFLVSEGK